MLNGRFYGCRDARGCLLTRTVYVFMCGICNSKRMWVQQEWTWLWLCYELCWCEHGSIKRYPLHIFTPMKQKSLQTARPTCQYILHQHIVHNAIPLFMLIATCTNITAIGNKTGNTKPMVEAKYTRLCVFDFHCLVKCERQHSLSNNNGTSSCS